MKRSLIKRIAKIVGTDHLSIDPADLTCYSYDASGLSIRPDAVVFPRTAKEVSALLIVANREKVPVYPRGAGTGTTGASVPGEGGIVVCLSKMDRIKAIDRCELNMVVEPGAITGKIQAMAEEKGLFYPPDPASLNFCTIGGNVNTGAGGARAVKYGVTRDYVRALEVVLPTGRIIRTGTATAKGVVGYDLTRLMVGSEGTLGIVTEITLRLIPLPEEVGTCLCLFSDEVSALHAVTSFFQAGLLPRAAEFMDSLSLQCIRDKIPLDVQGLARSMLLVEVDGFRESIPRQMDTVRACCKEAGALLIRKAGSKEEADAFWQVRRSLSPAMKRLGFDGKISEDICVPRGKMPDILRELREIAARNDVTILSFGHAGDGNLHVNILFNEEGPQKRGADRAVADIMETTVRLGGTISGEHGVGLTKKPFVGLEIDEAQMETMKEIKKIFDPNNVLNPHKVFP